MGTPRIEELAEGMHKLLSDCVTAAQADVEAVGDLDVFPGWKRDKAITSCRWLLSDSRDGGSKFSFYEVCEFLGFDFERTQARIRQNLGRLASLANELTTKEMRAERDLREGRTRKVQGRS